MSHRPFPARVKLPLIARANPARTRARSASAPDYSAAEQGQTAPETLRLAVTAELDGERLDVALARLLPQHSRNRLKNWIRAGRVTLNGGGAEPDSRVGNRDAIELWEVASAEPYPAQPIPLEVVYEDQALIIINKPAGLVVHPGHGNWQGTLLNALLHHAPQLAEIPRAGIVHRLDKDTSGLLVVAKTLAAQTDLVRQLQARSVKRVYLAVVEGQPPQRGSIDQPIGRDPRVRTRMAVATRAREVEVSRVRQPRARDVEVSRVRQPPREVEVSRARDVDFDRVRQPRVRHPHREARTDFQVLERYAHHALLELRLHTGRTHQIRVHMQSLGFPIAGDPVYGPRSARAEKLIDRQALHAAELALSHPTTNAEIAWRAPLPADMAGLIEHLRASTSRQGKR